MILMLCCSLAFLFISYILTRSFAHPSTLMLITWNFVFIGLSVFQSNYYTYESLPMILLFTMIFIFCFSSLIGDRIFIARKRIRFVNINYLPILVLFVVICALALPLYIREQVSDLPGANNILFELRRSSLTNDSQAGSYANFLYISSVTTIFCLVEILKNKQNYAKILYITSFGVTFMYTVFTGSKGPPLQLLISNLIAYIILRPNRQISASIKILSVSVGLFAAGVFFVNFLGKSNLGDPSRVLEVSISYFVGGTAALLSNFSSVMAFDNAATIISSLASLLRLIGFSIPRDSIHSPYLEFSSGQSTNVYTFIFPIFKQFGYFGGYLFICLMGLFSSFLFARSKLENNYLVFYALFSISIVQSYLTDTFTYGILGYMKDIVTIAAIYYSSLFLYQKFGEKV